MSLVVGQRATRSLTLTEEHVRKYAEGTLPEDRSFYFRGADARLRLRASNLQSFLDLADGVDADTWLHHLEAHHYSDWVRSAIKDADLVELEGRSHLPSFGDSDAVVGHVRRFLGLPRLRREAATGLTARQTEVAALVADGLTNRQIAERLHITERSAESHLERIRLRLGFSSRAQVAAWFVASGAQVR